ncbi:MAG: type II secretion system protein GspC [Thermodesulfobacteriota bacterium]
MSKVLARHFWIIHLLFILTTSWLSARLVVIILQERLTGLPSPLITQSPSAPTAQAIPYQKYSLVVERNIFNPYEKGLKLLPLGETKGIPAKGGSEISAAEYLSTYRLVGTITGPGAYAYAIFQEGATKKQVIFRLHEKIGEGEIINIFRNQVVIRIRDKLETLAIAVKNKAERETSPTGRPMASAQKEDIVRRLSTNHFLINKEDVRAYVGNINQFMTQARFRPYFAMGRPAGYIISEIVPGSLFEKIGLRNNDVVKKVNGQMINQPEEVFQAYSQLLNDAQIEVEIERRGQTEVFKYEIR